MSEIEEKKTTENVEINGASTGDMDPEEAAVVARVLASLMVKAENAAGTASGTDSSDAAANISDSGPEADPASGTDTAQPESGSAAAAAPDALPAGTAAEEASADAPAEPHDPASQDKPADPPTLQHVLTEEELLAAEAAEQAAKKTFKGKSKSAFRRLISVATPDNKKLAIPALIAELLALAALIIILGRYSHVAPPTPTEYADDRKTDVIKCLDGELIVNGVTAKVPADGNVSYSISYVWAEDDTDYPSVPHAIIASYRGDPAPAASEEQAQDAASEQADEGGDKVVSSDELKKDAKASSGETASEDAGESSDKDGSEDANTASDKDSASDKSSGSDSSEDSSEDANTASGKDSASDAGSSEDSASSEEAETLYEISLYKDSFTAKKDIPEGKDSSNWFSDWTEEKSEDVYKFAHRVGKTRGFCISTLNSKTAPEDYRTYTYYFTVPENNGIALYVLEGTCYDPESREAFTTIIKNAINSIEVNIEET